MPNSTSSWNPRDTYKLLRDWGFEDSGNNVGDHFGMRWPLTGEFIHTVAPERPSSSPVNNVIFTKAARVVGVPVKVLKAGAPCRDVPKMLNGLLAVTNYEGGSSVPVSLPRDIPKDGLGWLVIAASNAAHRRGHDTNAFIESWFKTLDLDKTSFGLSVQSVDERIADDPDLAFLHWVADAYPNSNPASPPRFRLKELCEGLDWSPGKARRWLQGAAKQGYLTNTKGLYTVHRKFINAMETKLERTRDQAQAQLHEEWTELWAPEPEPPEPVPEPVAQAPVLAPVRAIVGTSNQPQTVMTVIGTLRTGALLAECDGKFYECYEVQGGEVVNA